MLSSNRTKSVEFPRPKIYLSHLNQLIDKRVVVQPEIQVNNKLFPQRNFARKLATSHQRIKSSIQIRSQKFDLHWSARKAKNTVVENHLQSNKNFKQIKLQLPRTKSNQLPTTNSIQKDDNINMYSTYTGLPNNSSPQSYSSSVSPQKNFLKRGSNIQKQIVVNLLRNKLMRQRQLHQKKQYSNSEIIKMIQVFKGVSMQQSSKKGLLSHRQPLQGRKTQMPRDIKGWQHQPLHDFQLQQEKD